MFYEVLMEKRASRRRVNPSDLRLAQLHRDDDDLKRRIHKDNLLFGGAAGALVGVPTAVMVDDILKYDQKAQPRTRALSALGIPLGATALGAYGVSRLFPATDEYVKRLRAAQDKRSEAYRDDLRKRDKKERR